MCVEVFFFFSSPNGFIIFFFYSIIFTVSSENDKRRPDTPVVNLCNYIQRALPKKKTLHGSLYVLSIFF